MLDVVITLRGVKDSSDWKKENQKVTISVLPFDCNKGFQTKKNQVVNN